jgi:hypothetical protein
MDELTSQPTTARPGELDFLWVENDGLLRDEGVVFGLSQDNAALEYKVAAITAYYSRWRADAERRTQALRQEIEDVAAVRDGLSMTVAQETRAPVDGQFTETDEPGTGVLLRYALGALAAIATCVGISVLAYEQLRPDFALAGVVTAGVVAAGFFTAFLPVSILFVGDGTRRTGEVELWKVRLAEFGLPLVSAAFVVAWAWERLGPARAAATGALLFLAFVFAGRQFLSSVPRMAAAWRSLRAARRARAAELAGARKAQADEASIRSAEDRLVVLRRQLGGIRGPAEWDAIRDAKLALFRSEYELAAARARDLAAQAILSSSLGSY